MLTRILAGLVLAPPFLFCVWKGGAWFFALAFFLAMMAEHEYVQLLKAGGIACQALVGYVWTALLFAGMWLGGEKGLLAATAVVPNVLLLRYLSKEDIGGAAAECAWTCYGVVAYALPLSFLWLLRNQSEGPGVLFVCLTLVWVQDSAAYFWGMGLGKHKFSPFISPKKTWEGAVLGWLTAIAAVWAVVTYGLGWTMSPGALVGFAAAGISAQLGDLNESLLKRNMGVKDSGTLIPGHGGILDRFDSFTFAAPVMYYVVQAAAIH
jgi:phosphatidate cytidylyltransferase